MDNLSKSLDLIKEFEGLKLEAYLCPAGVPTIGYGATGSDIKLGLKWNKQQADNDLLIRVKKIADQVEAILVYKISQDELCALISFVYNLGIGSLKGSTLLKKLNSDSEESPSSEFLKWDKATVGGQLIPLKGLRARRIAEMVLFDEGRVIQNAEAVNLIPKYYG